MQLDEETIRQAKVVAAKRDTSVSRLVAENIEDLVRDDGDYQAARKRAMARMRRGFDLGGGPYYADRGELHERR